VVDATLKARLLQLGIAVLERLSLRHFDAVQSACGARVLSSLHISDIAPDALGACDAIDECALPNGKRMLFFSPPPERANICTLLLCAPDEARVEELRTAATSALTLLSSVALAPPPRLCVGAGITEWCTAQHLVEELWRKTRVCSDWKSGCERIADEQRRRVMQQAEAAGSGQAASPSLDRTPDAALAHAQISSALLSTQSEYAVTMRAVQAATFVADALLDVCHAVHRCQQLQALRPEECEQRLRLAHDRAHTTSASEGCGGSFYSYHARCCCDGLRPVMRLQPAARSSTADARATGSGNTVSDGLTIGADLACRCAPSRASASASDADSDAAIPILDSRSTALRIDGNTVLDSVAVKMRAIESAVDAAGIVLRICSVVHVRE
jgi:hypothetical protein